MTTAIDNLSPIVSWGGLHDDGPKSAPRLKLFGALMDRAVAIVAKYRSDWLAVAEFVLQLPRGGQTFWFIVDPSGTTICGSEADFHEANAQIGGKPGGRSWRVDVIDTRGTAQATPRPAWHFTEVTEPLRNWRIDDKEHS